MQEARGNGVGNTGADVLSAFRESVMSQSALSRVYVGNLNWKTTSESLKQLFGVCGEIHRVEIVLEPDTGRSRGFGFVTFVSPEQAGRAIEELNDYFFEGRTLRVNAASSRRPSPPAHHWQRER